MRLGEVEKCFHSKSQFLLNVKFASMGFKESKNLKSLIYSFVLTFEIVSNGVLHLPCYNRN